MLSTEEQTKQYQEAKEKIEQALSFRSRVFLGLCKNQSCLNARRSNSAYCQDCSDKYNKKLLSL